MPTLYLLRHAKSSWGDPELPDHDRPLAPRGERAAALIGEHLRSAGIAPALVLCSSAVRARETLDRVAPEGELRIEPELYGAEEHDLLERVRLLPSRVESVMLIGHNPGLQELALLLAGQGEALADLHRKFPTAALVTLGFEGEWDQLGPGVARLEGFVRPRDLG
jgi:phosphohistidine phosphatase